MAFNFNWSPLIADTDRVRQMLTTSLNKSPKPPIIVDDILVNELNLGSTPPSLEILEVGDLAADRFRGIFKVRYEGDAYLTLKTRVQANPLNTFLSTKSSFASPTPLAAGSGLTIPLQITLSDIRLSGFVILVFSRQKGITLVFRNDPLESLKVSSTFDSIPFVRDYLQKTIEGQLRVLFMEDLPAIIHRLSLKVFSDEGREIQQQNNSEKKEPVDQEEVPRDALSSTSQDADSSGMDTPFFTFDLQAEMYASFSQKNLLRLAALSESQRTLSLFTPSIRDTVYRAWASSAAAERSGLNDNRNSTLHSRTDGLPTLSRIQSSLNASNNAAYYAASSAASSVSDAPPSHASRPSLMTQPTVSTTYSLSSTGRSRAHGQRKRKHRVVNLRRNTDGTQDGLSEADGASVASSGYDDSASRSESAGAGLESPLEVSTRPTSSMPPSTSSAQLRKTAFNETSYWSKEREGEVHTPRTSPKKKVDFQHRPDPSYPTEKLEDTIAGAEQDDMSATLRPRSSRPSRRSQLHDYYDDLGAEHTPKASMYLPSQPVESTTTPRPTLPARSQTHYLPSDPVSDSTNDLHRSSSDISISNLASAFNYPFPHNSFPFNTNDVEHDADLEGGILEQAWLTKMARDLKVAAGREKWERRKRRMEEVGEAPPAYGV